MPPGSTSAITVELLHPPLVAAETIPAEMYGEWSTGLLDCCRDDAVCWGAMLFPSCLFAKTAKAFDGSSALGSWLAYLCCAWGHMTELRQRMRKKYNIDSTCW